MGWLGGALKTSRLEKKRDAEERAPSPDNIWPPNDTRGITHVGPLVLCGGKEDLKWKHRKWFLGWSTGAIGEPYSIWSRPRQRPCAAARNPLCKPHPQVIVKL